MRLTEEQLYKRRRMNEARRLYKKAPILAFLEMTEKHQGYTESDFFNDLRKRSKPKKKAKKDRRIGNLKYQLLKKEFANWMEAGGPVPWKVIKLLKSVKKPFVFRIGKTYYTFPNTISQNQLNRLSEAMNKSHEAFETEYQNYYKHSGYGN